ncbi:MAG: class I tRNA ligase family protein, partial [Lachnospiraceae bacterium]|nr:class I tRNA ligase family protein [Lachnospiraceae bacterium]
ANGKEFAKYWMHNAFLNIDNRKMSKSLGNFRTVREISEQYDLQVLRFFMLSAHYRSPLNFSADLMEASKNGLERIVNAADNLKFLIGNAKAEVMTEEEKEAFTKAGEFTQKFEEAMDDDFNTADAVAAVFDLVKYINTTANADSSKEYLKNLFDLLVKLTDVLGLIVDKKEDILDEEIEKLIEERQAARKAKDFARADAIRDELLAKGIILKDTREGVQWKRA